MSSREERFDIRPTLVAMDLHEIDHGHPVGDKCDNSAYREVAEQLLLKYGREKTKSLVNQLREWRNPDPELKDLDEALKSMKR